MGCTVGINLKLSHISPLTIGQTHLHSLGPLLRLKDAPNTGLEVGTAHRGGALLGGRALWGFTLGVGTGLRLLLLCTAESKR